MSGIGTFQGDSLPRRFGPPSWRQIGLIAFALLLLALVVIAADNLWAQLWRERYWSILFTAPAVIVYIMIVAHVLDPYGRRAVASLRRMSLLEGDHYAELVDQAEAASRRATPMVFAVGFAFGFLASTPWLGGEGYDFLPWYHALLNGLMFGLLAVVIQQALAESRLAHRLQQGPLQFDIFHTAPFMPIGLYSLMVALAFVGGSSLGFLFSTAGHRRLELSDSVVHGVLIVLTLLIFFLPLRQTHRVLRDAKLAEQDNLRRHLAAAYRRLEAMSPEERQDLLSFSAEVALWRQYEERLNQVSTWPYNAPMLRTLFVSVLLPILITLSQRVAALILSQLGLN